MIEQLQAQVPSHLFLGHKDHTRPTAVCELVRWSIFPQIVRVLSVGTTLAGVS